MRKGFLQGAIEWEPIVLEELTTLVSELLPTADVDWTQKIVVNYTIDKMPRASLVTKRPSALELAITVKAGTIQLGQISNLGIDPEISSRDKSGFDVIRLRFTDIVQVKSVALRKFLSEQWK